MALAAVIDQVPFEQGQNEGVEKSVLPAGQFAYLQNARFRKSRRLGKRNGYTSVSSLGDGGLPLGNILPGYGRLNCLGNNFCAVDDLFYRRDETAGVWRKPQVGVGSTTVPGTRLLGRFPEFLPGPSVFATTLQSDVGTGGIAGTDEDSIAGLAVDALGYVWSSLTYYSANSGSWKIRVSAIDPATGGLVYQEDVTPSSSPPSTARLDCILLTTGDRGTVVLCYDLYTAGLKSGIAFRTIASVTSVPTAEVTLACLQSAVCFAPGFTDRVLVVVAGGGASYVISLYNPTTGTAIATTTRSTTTTPFDISVHMHETSGNIWVGYDNTTGLFVNTHSGPSGGALPYVATSPDWRAAGVDLFNCQGPIHFTESEPSSDRVVAIAEKTGAGGERWTTYFRITAVATFGTSMVVLNSSLLSQPFRYDGRCYVWLRPAANTTYYERFGGQLGKAALVRIPDVAEYNANPAPTFQRSFPVQAQIDAYPFDRAPIPLDSGPVVSRPVVTAMGIVALLQPTTESTVVTSGGATVLLRRPLLVPVHARADGLRYAQGCVIDCAGRVFVAGGVPQWVDEQGAAEAGFVAAPSSMNANPNAGSGDLTVGGAYSWTAVFEAVDPRGNIERSAPAAPASVTLSGGQNEAQILVSVSQFSARRAIRCKLYRTVADGSTFHLVSSVGADPAQNISGFLEFIDDVGDEVIAQNETLYTNIGQELATSPFPACTFANVGGSRLWVGGGFRADTAQASKRFLPRIAPEFADDDAFRVTLPEDITGMAWLDAQVLFTQNGIWVVNGDGPDGAGVGFFTVSQLPFAVGCIDWRSVVATELGIFFQSPRGLYLLPRGFGPPVAMDQVLDTLTTYPIITASRVYFSSRGGADNTEQTVQWCAVADEAATSGVIITFDLSYKAFYVDTFTADYPATFLAGWSGDPVSAPADTRVGPNGASRWHPFRRQDTSFDDEGLSIDMRGVTGDLRPWGEFAHGVVNRVGFLGELRSACDFEVRFKSDVGEGPWRERLFRLAVGDAQVGDASYVEVPLGNDEKRDIVSLRVSFHEDSTSEGFAPFGLYVERQKEMQGWRLNSPKSRVNVRPDALLTESGAEVLTTEDGEQLVTEDGS